MTAPSVGAWTGIDAERVNQFAVEEVFPPPPVFWARMKMWEPIFAKVDSMASHPDTWNFLVMLIAAMNPKTIVEAGTYRGHAALAMAEAWHTAEADPNTHQLYTADTTDFRVGDVLKQTGLDVYVRPYVAPFDVMLRDVLVPVDLAFIDASSKENPHLRLEHVNAVTPKMARGGVIVVDDATDDQWGGAKILRDACDVYLPVGRGIALFQPSR